MTHTKYILFKEIQQEIYHEYKENKLALNFRDAVLRLWRSNRCHTGQPSVPDFSFWNTENLEELRNFCGQIPIHLDEILSVIPRDMKTRQAILLPSSAEVQISLESIYAPSVYTVLQDYFIIIYVLSGYATLHIRETVHEMEAGTLAILPPGIPYYVSCTEKDLVLSILSLTALFEKHFFGILQKNQLIYSFFQKALYGPEQEYLLFLVPPDRKITEIIRNLFTEFLSEDAFGVDVFLNYLQIFYAQILRSPEHTYQRYKSGEHITSYALLPALFQYIQTNFRTLDLQTLAKEFHYNPAYLSRLIHKCSGKPFIRILTDLKIEEAKTLLLHSEYSISTIAGLVGYRSSDHFASTFKKETGMTPSGFRKLPAESK